MRAHAAGARARSCSPGRAGTAPAPRPSQSAPWELARSSLSGEAAGKLRPRLRPGVAFPLEGKAPSLASSRRRVAQCYPSSPRPRRRRQSPGRARGPAHSALQPARRRLGGHRGGARGLAGLNGRIPSGGGGGSQVLKPAVVPPTPRPRHAAGEVSGRAEPWGRRGREQAPRIARRGGGRPRTRGWAGVPAAAGWAQVGPCPRLRRPRTSLRARVRRPRSKTPFRRGPSYPRRPRGSLWLSLASERM